MFRHYSGTRGGRKRRYSEGDRIRGYDDQKFKIDIAAAARGEIGITKSAGEVFVGTVENYSDEKITDEISEEDNGIEENKCEAVSSGDSKADEEANNVDNVGGKKVEEPVNGDDEKAAVEGKSVDNGKPDGEANNNGSESMVNGEDEAKTEETITVVADNGSGKVKTEEGDTEDEDWKLVDLKKMWEAVKKVFSWLLWLVAILNDKIIGYLERYLPKRPTQSPKPEPPKPGPTTYPLVDCPFLITHTPEMILLEFPVNGISVPKEVQVTIDPSLNLLTVDADNGMKSHHHLVQLPSVAGYNFQNAVGYGVLNTGDLKVTITNFKSQTIIIPVESMSI